MTDKTAGIIGGMGPQATVDLMQRIIRLTPASDDNEHIRCIVDNNPKIPSRIKSIVQGDGEDPTPILCEMAKGLEAAGADFLAMPCNTAHFYYKTLQEAVSIPVVNIIDTVLQKLLQDHSKIKAIALLGSPALQITKIYETQFAKAGIAVHYPEQQDQALLFDIIKDVKADKINNHSLTTYNAICNNLSTRGFELAIVACTELSVINSTASIKRIDAAEVLALEIIKRAKA